LPSLHFFQSHPEEDAIEMFTVSYDFPSNEWNSKRFDAAARITKNYSAGQYRNITKKRK